MDESPGISGSECSSRSAMAMLVSAPPPQEVRGNDMGNRRIEHRWTHQVPPLTRDSAALVARHGGATRRVRPQLPHPSPRRTFISPAQPMGPPCRRR